MVVSRLVSRLLYHRLEQVFSGQILQIKAAEIFLPLADLAAIVSLLVAVEIARRAFRDAGSRIWIAGTLAALAVGGVVLKFWGAWPSLKTMFAGSLISNLQLMGLIAEKTDLFAQVLMVLVGLLVALFGRYYKAGWHSHTQQIAIGLTMASVAQLTIRGASQHIVTTANASSVHTQDEYNRVMALLRQFQTANGIILLLVLIWWIVCLWSNEPGMEMPSDGDRAAAANGQ